MKRASFIIALIAVGCGSQEEQLVEDALRSGADFFKDGSFSLADSSFTQAPADARAVHNSGSARYRLHQWTDAIGRFRTASEMDTTRSRQASFRYDLACAHLAEAFFADTLIDRHQTALSNVRTDGNDIAEKVAQYVLRDSLQREVVRLNALIDSSLSVASEGFKGALRKDPSFEDARHNLAYTQRWQSQRPKADGTGNDGNKDDEKDKELSAKAKLLLEQADKLVEQFLFQQALDLMQQGLKQDPSLKNKKEYMDKLDVVTRSANAK